MTKGLSSLSPLATKLIFPNYVDKVNQPNTARRPMDSSNQNLVDPFYTDFFDANKATKTENNNVETKKFRFTIQLESEIVKYTQLLETVTDFNLNFSEFWLSNSKIYPILSKLTKILYNISSTSAVLERFFSLSGIVCSARRSNMKDDLIIMRSLLKANVKILKELNNSYEIHNEFN